MGSILSCDKCCICNINLILSENDTQYYQIISLNIYHKKYICKNCLMKL